MSWFPPVDLPAAASERGLRALSIALSFYAVANLYSMAAMNIAAAIVAVVFVVACGSGKQAYSQIRKNLGEAVFRRFAWLTLALAGAITLSLVTAWFFPLPEVSMYPLRQVARDYARIWYLVLPFLFVPAIGMLAPAQRNRVLGTWLAMFGVMGAVGIQQYFTGWPKPQPIPLNAPYFHATLRLGHHLTVASILIFPLFVALDAARVSLGWRRVALIFAALLGSVALYMTYSRTLWVALPIGLVLWVLLSLRWRQALVLLTLMAVVGAGVVSRPEVHTRLSTQMGVSERQGLWATYGDFFKLRPWTGAGWYVSHDASRRYMIEQHPTWTHPFFGHAHSNLYEMAGSTGALGFLSWLAWSGFVLFIAWQLSRRVGGIWGPGLFCAWSVFQLNGLTQLNFWDSRVMHQMMWAISWMMIAIQLRSSGRREHE